MDSAQIQMQDLKFFLEGLDLIDQKRFVQLIIKNHIPFSENKNGIFLNVSELTQHQLQIVTRFKDLLTEEENNFNKFELAKTNMKKLMQPETTEST